MRFISSSAPNMKLLPLRPLLPPPASSCLSLLILLLLLLLLMNQCKLICNIKVTPINSPIRVITPPLLLSDSSQFIDDFNFVLIGYKCEFEGMASILLGQMPSRIPDGSPGSLQDHQRWPKSASKIHATVPNGCHKDPPVISSSTWESWA